MIGAALVNPPEAPGAQVLQLVPPERDDAGLSVEELGSRIVGLAGRLSAATCRWLLLIATFDEREGYGRFGLASTTRWLAHHCGISARTAAEHVRVARALRMAPELAAEMSAGRLSYSHVRAITRLCAPGEQRLVGDLIQLARHGTIGQVEDMVRGLRTVAGHEATAAPPESSPGSLGVAGPDPEYVDTRWGSDSRWQLRARLDPERGAMVGAALARLAECEQVGRAEALVRMAEIALAALADGGARRELRGDERAAVVIHVDARDVPNPPASEDSDRRSVPTDHAAPPPTDPRPDAAPPHTDLRPRAELDSGGPSQADPRPGPGPRSVERPLELPFARLVGGPGLSAEVVYRLLCDGGLRTVVYETDPDGRRRLLDVGRSKRLVTGKQFRALVARDGGGCAVPGCGSRRRLHVHHVQHWLHGGATNADNEVVLCEPHHRQIHAGQIKARATGPGRFVFLRADGASLMASVDPTILRATDAPIEAEHPDVGPDAAHSKWDGTRLDRHYAISVLAEARAGTRQTRRTNPHAQPQPQPQPPNYEGAGTSGGP